MKKPHSGAVFLRLDFAEDFRAADVGWYARSAPVSAPVSALGRILAGKRAP
ncbi:MULTISPECIES: hypothetical protein [Comamonas]|uniref:hypothetical protein n=1 Tax=Comamonas TaxID=283 RepID=UPI00135F1716|nr:MULTISPECIES: hypothetical protein [Comamonas]